MSGTTIVHSFGVSPITTHSWNGDQSQIVLSQNNKEAQIYEKKGSEWKPKTMLLDQHDLRITGIDWAPRTNRIVTCSADRNAYVWSLNPDGTWKHTLVLLRINRAATCVSWSPEENKFAVGCGARLINVCYFEQENDWWVSKHIKKPIKSTITCIDWHPNNILLAAGSTDFKARVFSGYIKDIEEKPSGTSWGSKMPFSSLMAEFSNSTSGGGWVHDISFSHDGSRLAWIGHDSSISVVDSTKGNSLLFTLKTGSLPLLSLIWISDNSIVAGGHDCIPMLFQIDESGKVAFKAKLEEDKKIESNTKFSAKALFQNKDRVGLSVVSDTILNSTHQNQISCIRILKGNKKQADVISTTAGDGKLVIWDLRSMEKKMAGLKI